MQLRASAPEGAADAARARLRLAVGLAVLLALLAGATRAWDAAPAGYTEPNPPPRASRRTLLEEEPVADAFPVAIALDRPGPVTPDPAPLFTLDFGRPLAEADPLALFTAAGVDRVDVVYLREEGLLYVVAYAQPAAPATVRVAVAAGAARDAATGAPCAAAALEITYVPPPTGPAWLGAAAGLGTASALALGFAAAAAAPGAPLGVGALGLAGFAQTFYLTSTQLPLTGLPDAYRAAGGALAWAAMRPDIVAVPGDAAVAAPPPPALADPLLRFPYPPVVVRVRPAGAGAWGGGAGGAGAGGRPTAADVDALPLGVLEVVTTPLPGSRTGAPAPNPLVAPPAPAGGAGSSSGGGGSSSGSGSSGGGTAVAADVEPGVAPGAEPVGPWTVWDGPGSAPASSSGSGSGSASSKPTRDFFISDAAGGGAAAAPARDPAASFRPGSSGLAGRAGGGATLVAAAAPAPAPAPCGGGGAVLSVAAVELSPVRSAVIPLAPAPAPAAQVPAPLAEGEGELVLEGWDGPAAASPLDEGAAAPTAAPATEPAAPAELPPCAAALVPAPAPAPAPTPGSLAAPAPGPGPQPAFLDEPSEEDGLEEAPSAEPPASPPAAPSPAAAPEAPKDEEEKEVDEVEAGEGEGKGESQEAAPPSPAPASPSPSPRDAAPPPADAARRRALRVAADPFAALASSGFSYTVATVTAADVAAGGESAASAPGAPGVAVGASALSRIRAVREVAAGPDADARALQVLWDVLFWTAVALAGTAAAHALALLALRAAKRSAPKMLAPPRLELLVFMMALPMIAAAGAALLHAASPGARAAGALFGLVLPFGFLAAAAAVVARRLITPPLEERTAAYVLLGGDAAFEAAWATGGPGSSAGAAPRGFGGPASLTLSMLPGGADSHAGGGAGANLPSGALSSAGGPATVGAPARRGPLARAGAALSAAVLRPLLGLPPAGQPRPDAAAAWLGGTKAQAQFVRRYGCLFEDARGPQAVRVRSQFERVAAAATADGSAAAEADGSSLGGGVLVPAGAGAGAAAMQAAQAFGVLLAVAKMCVFAVVVAAPGGVDSLAQVAALLLVSLAHLAYLRFCLPYRLRVELAAELVAGAAELGVFACGVALVAQPAWSPEQRQAIGAAMLALQGVGFVTFIAVRVALAARTAGGVVSPLLAPLRARRRGGAAAAAPAAAAANAASGSGSGSGSPLAPR